MEDSNSSQPSKCPCGFWGSANTMGLCSRCYKEHLQSKETLQASTSGKPGLSSKDAPSTSALRVPPKAVPSNASTSSTENFLKSSSIVCDSSTADSGATGVNRLSPHTPITSVNTDSNTDSAACDSSGRGISTKSTNEQTAERAEVTTTVIGSDNNVQDNISRCSSTDSLSSTDAEKRGTKRSIGEMEDTGGKSPQKNRKRCNQCNVKLELAQRTIGQCRCGCIFCPLHRLPELHDCEFDHKEDGRKEAREKMLKPTRHVGNSCKRIDS